ncbi:unnamed protein product [Pylaiella littoralis]
MMVGDQGGYAELRGGFLECHRVKENVLLHIITGLLGAGGAFGLAHACTNRSLGAIALLATLYTVSLLHSTAIPLALVLVVTVCLVLVMALVRWTDLGVAGSLAAVVIGYLGQDAAHYFSGEHTFQSTYSSDISTLSVESALAWIADFSRHTFFLLPLTADAAVETLTTPDNFAWPFLEVNNGVDVLATPPPAWLLAFRQNAWVLATLALWVAGCYALDSDSGPFPWMFVKRRVLRVNLKAEGLRKDLAAIRKWATGHKPSRNTTTHWWFADLAGGDGGESGAFTRVAECSEIDTMFREKFSKHTYAIEAITGMNEVYVSGPAKSGSSDAVFTTRHIDGPWALIPFCSTYRCILGLDSSAVYTTVFPNVAGLTTTCRTGDIVCFDYNREIHYIEGYAKAKEEQAKLAPADGGDGYRIVLKLHYCVYPRIFWSLGKLAAAMSTWYNSLFRSLFLFTLAPSSVWSRLMAFFVVQVTVLYRAIIETGLQNLLYVVALFAVGRLIHPVAFLVGTSFVHYPRYITTYYHRSSDVNFGTFKSDALFFKVVALSHIGCRYAMALFYTFTSTSAAAAAEETIMGTANTFGDGINNDSTTGGTILVALSLAMITFGTAVSTLAAKALGVNGTYFGPELGMCEMKWVTGFPYNCHVPHPMIVGQLVAFLGVHLLPEFRAAWPWLMPAHCAFYVVVMMQEHFDVHAKAGKSGRVAGYNGGVEG